MKQKVLLIGAGAAGSVFVRKWDQLLADDFDLHVASRRLESCEAILDACKHSFPISCVDADDVDALIHLFEQVKPFLVVNLALPYQDLTIMDACLATGVHYLDTANYEPRDTAEFCYKWQWAYQDRFKDAGLMALLGCGFDPGVTSVFSRYALDTYFDSIESIDILDCNAGDHGHAFATNFNPEINIREITSKGKYYENGEWIEVDALSQSQVFDFPEVGEKRAYLMYHEELESLAKHISGVKRLRFWMTFSESYLTHLKVLETVGLTGIHPVMHNGEEIIPIEFLKTLLPEPSSLAERYTGKTCIGCLVKGVKDGEAVSKFIYNVCDHRACYLDVGSQAISFTTGVPALMGAMLMLRGDWLASGVFNVEQMDAMPFIREMDRFSLPMKELDDVPCFD